MGFLVAWTDQQKSIQGTILPRMPLNRQKLLVSSLYCCKCAIKHVHISTNGTEANTGSSFSPVVAKIDAVRPAHGLLWARRREEGTGRAFLQVGCPGERSPNTVVMPDANPCSWATWPRFRLLHPSETCNLLNRGEELPAASQLALNTVQIVLPD